MQGQRFIIVGDSHGDMVDRESADAVFEFCKQYKPEIRVHLGDAFDFRNLRRGATDDEKADSLRDDWDDGVDFLSRFFTGGKSNHFLYGNHDFRLFDFSNNCSGLLRDYATDGIEQLTALCTKLKAKTLPYDAAFGVLKLGHLNVIHGYHAGNNACKLHAAIYGNCVFGHVHTIESAPVPSLEPAEARSIGCLCIRDMDYINKKTGKLKWSQGFCYGVLFPDGSYQLFQTRKINGKFYVASDISEL